MKKILIVVITLLYSVMFGEVFLRVMAPVAIVPRYVKETEYGIRGNIPNATYRHTGAEYNVEIRTNSAGIRADREIAKKKPNDTFRVVLLGDSFGMGYEVSLEDSFASRLEHHYEHLTGKKCEVVNLSTSGHGNAEELIVLQERGLAYEPDLILLSWHRTDYQDNLRSNLYAIEDGELKRAAQQYLPGVEARAKLSKIPAYVFMIENSQFFNLTREWLARNTKKLLVALKKPTADPTPQSQMVDAETTSSEISRFATHYEDRLAIALLNEIQAVSNESGAEFMILDVPHRSTRTVFSSTLPPTLLNTTTHSYSPIEDFQPHLGKKLYWEKGHNHFTPLACDVVGKGLAAYIIRNGLDK